MWPHPTCTQPTTWALLTEQMQHIALQHSHDALLKHVSCVQHNVAQHLAWRTSGFQMQTCHGCASTMWHHGWHGQMTMITCTKHAISVKNGKAWCNGTCNKKKQSESVPHAMPSCQSHQNKSWTENILRTCQHNVASRIMDKPTITCTKHVIWVNKVRCIAKHETTKKSESMPLYILCNTNISQRQQKTSLVVWPITWETPPPLREQQRRRIPRPSSFLCTSGIQWTSIPMTRAWYGDRLLRANL